MKTLKESLLDDIETTLTKDFSNPCFLIAMLSPKDMSDNDKLSNAYRMFEKAITPLCKVKTSAETENNKFKIVIRHDDKKPLIAAKLNGAYVWFVYQPNEFQKDLYAVNVKRAQPRDGEWAFDSNHKIYIPKDKKFKEQLLEFFEYLRWVELDKYRAKYGL